MFLVSKGSSVRNNFKMITDKCQTDGNCSLLILLFQQKSSHTSKNLTRTNGSYTPFISSLCKSWKETGAFSSQELKQTLTTCNVENSEKPIQAH